MKENREKKGVKMESAPTVIRSQTGYTWCF
jgi:hypothetical protein